MSKGWPRRAIVTSARSARIGMAPWPFSDWLANLPGNRYSRRVALLKMALPAIGATLLLLVTAWPRIAPLFDRMRFAAIDLREARELRMMNPRYAGTDRENRPYIVTAAIGRQVPGRDDVMSLEAPKADLKAHSGASLVVTADSGVYQSEAQLLDMFGNVTMVQENGTRFVTASARLDVANNAAEGHDPIKGHGPSGDIEAQGFHILDKGDIVIFTGQSNLLLKSTKASEDKTQPAAVPPVVAQAAVQLEAKAAPRPVPAAARRPATKPHAQPAVLQTTKAPAHPKPAAKKTS